VSSGAAIEQLNSIKQKIKHELEHVNINHVTIEFETEDENCVDTKKI
jgi:Co/Zn/Cd efflux system component